MTLVTMVSPLLPAPAHMLALDLAIPGLAVVRFAEPWALALLALVPLVALTFAYAARRGRAADEAYGTRTAARPGTGRRRLRAALLVAAIAALALGAARPQWGEGDTVLTRQGIDVVIALDVSRSMTADDIEPTRAQAAAAGLRRMLEHLRGDRVGLVVFGSTAFERSPLTDDLEAVATLLDRAQRETALVRPGTEIAPALRAALDTLDVEAPANAQVIVLVSDGEDLGGGLAEPIDRAQRAGVRIYTVAVGTEEGAEVPGADEGTALTRLDRDTLADIASATGGNLREVEQVAGLAVEFRRLAQTTFEATDERALVDRFPWFLAAGLGLLLLGTALPDAGGTIRARRRRPSLGVVGAALAGLFLVACGGTTLYREVSAGNRHHEEARYEEALERYLAAQEIDETEPAVGYNLSNTLHELSRFGDAVAAATAALELATEEPELAAQLRYALGNHAFRLEEMLAAYDAYIAVLRAQPGDLDAKANLELVLRELGIEPGAPPPTPTPEPGEPGDDGEEPPNGEEPGDGNGDEPGDGEPPDGDPAEPGDGEPGDGGTGEPGDGNGEPSNGDPGDSTPGDPQPGGPGTPGGDPETLDEARAALAEAAVELGPEVSLEEALRILELVRRVNSLDSLEDRRPTGPATDR